MGYGDTGLRPGNGVSALFLPCERGSHCHTAVVTRPRLSLANNTNTNNAKMTIKAA